MRAGSQCLSPGLQFFVTFSSQGVHRLATQGFRPRKGQRTACPDPSRDGWMTLRLSCCELFLRLLFPIAYTKLNPGPQEEVETMAATAEATRRCANSKSRAHPDVQCPLTATYGDYCYRHYKHPRRFVATRAQTGEEGWVDTPTSQRKAVADAAACIQRAWRRAAPLLRWKRQGPAANAPELANNQSELYSFDALSSIPRLYFFSFADERRTLWAFDIRTLAHSMGVSEGPPLNPYTREQMPAAAVKRLQARVAWLRGHGYQIQHITTDILTPEQLWNQKVLDVFLKIEALGYYANADWFHALSQPYLIVLYRRLEALWNWRLGLSPLERETIVPGHADNSERRLFKFVAEDHFEKSRGWWARQVLGVADALISRAVETEHRKLGAMYVLMGLVQTSRAAAMALPWVLELVM